MISDPIELYITSAHECPYLEGRQAMNLLVDPSRVMDAPSYVRLLKQGFRRSGGEVYRPCCRQCSACVSTRIPVQAFKPSRSQKRALKANTDIVVRINRSGFRPEYESLYQRYIQARHAGGGMDDDPVNTFAHFVTSPWSTTVFMEFYLDEALIGVAVTDELQSSLSLVYTFFEPELSRKRSLGVFAILKQIEWAQEQSMTHVYPGYWIAESEKMNYKTRFQPIEGYIDGHWVALQKECKKTENKRINAAL